MNHRKPRPETWETVVKGMSWAAPILIAVLVLSFLFFIPAVERVLGSEHEKWAHYGEAYIIWHSLFDTLACCLLGLTLLMQYYDFRKRERQFRDQQFQSTFLPYLTLFQAYIENMACGDLRGRYLLAEWGGAVSPNHNEALTLENKIDKFKQLMDGYGPSVNHYFRHLETLLLLIKLAHLSEEEKDKYTTIVKSQLSRDEKILFAAYCEAAPQSTLNTIAKQLEFFEDKPL